MYKRLNSCICIWLCRNCTRKKNLVTELFWFLFEVSVHFVKGANQGLVECSKMVTMECGRLRCHHNLIFKSGLFFLLNLQVMIKENTQKLCPGYLMLAWENPQNGPWADEGTASLNPFYVSISNLRTNKNCLFQIPKCEYSLFLWALSHFKYFIYYLKSNIKKFVICGLRFHNPLLTPLRLCDMIR